MKKMLILCLAFVAIAAAQAQNLMRVHVHNAAPVDIETAKIDSLHWENSTTLRIFLNDQTTTAYALQNVDSLTWLLPEPAADPLTVGGVTLGSGEQFVINDTLTTVHASDCTVRFSTTVTDTSTPLTIRTATQAPSLQATPEDPDTELVDIGRNATTVDVSLDGITTLDGFVEIRIPVSLSAEGNIPGAAWYDPTTQKWDPISYDYDTRTGEVVIYSNHLSIYTGYEVEYEHTRQARLNFIDVPITFDDDIQPGIYDMIEDALADAVDWTDYVVKWSDVINTCGLDIGYAGLKSCGLKIGLLEKYSEQIGKIGTILGTYQIMRAGLSGDHETAGLSTMKMLVGRVSSAAADAIGTSVMTAAMCGVAIIDYALNQMWETAWDDRQQLYRTMYEHYYSRSANDGLTHHHMTAPQWYKKFMPIFEKGSTETSDVKEQIDKIVDDYVWEFWTQVDEGDFEIYWANITNLPWSYYGGLSEKTKKDLADWHRAELYATTFPLVFETIGRDLKIKNYNLLKTEMKKWVKTANQIITLQISASNTANTSADLSGYRVRFKDLPTTLTDPKKWETTLGANGQGKIQFRFYPYYTEGVQPILEIVSPSGKVLAEQEITIDEGTNNISIKFKEEITTPTLLLSAETYRFKVEGGKAEVTFTTNCPNIEVFSTPSWCDAEINGETITVTAQANSGEARDGYIAVRAYGSQGQIAQRLHVFQSGIDGKVKKTLNRVNFKTMRMTCTIPVEGYWAYFPSSFTYGIGAIQFDIEADSTCIVQSTMSPDGKDDDDFNERHVYTATVAGQRGGINFNVVALMEYNDRNGSFTTKQMTGHVSYGPAADDALTYSFNFTLPNGREDEYLPELTWSKGLGSNPSAFTPDYLQDFSASYYNGTETVNLPLGDPLKYSVIYPYKLSVTLKYNTKLETVERDENDMQQ